MLGDTERASCPPSARTAGRETQLKPRLLSRRRADFYRLQAQLDYCAPSLGICISGLFFAMLLGLSDRCLFRMSSRVNGVRASGVSVVGGFLMMPRLVMLSRFPMAGSMGVMF